MSTHNRPTVYFHIGVPKSGTTYIQQTLYRNRAALRAAGLLYPGTSDSHFMAYQDLRGWQIGKQTDGSPAGEWLRLVRNVERWRGPVIIDHELFCGANRATVDRALSDLSFADVHIVLTARDLARQLPAVWQTRIRTGAGGSFADFLAAVRSGPPGRGTARPFWDNQAVPEILARWGCDLPADRIHLVTVPPRGGDTDLLWRRFAGAVGIDPAECPGAPPGINSSLGATEVAIIRRINEARTEEELPWPIYARQIKNGYARALARRAGTGIELPEDVYRWAVDYSAEAVEKLRQAEYHVVGDLADLVPQYRPTGADPDAVSAEDQLNAAVAGLIDFASAAGQKQVRGRAEKRSTPPRRGRRARWAQGRPRNP